MFGSGIALRTSGQTLSQWKDGQRANFLAHLSVVGTRATARISLSTTHDEKLSRDGQGCSSPSPSFHHAVLPTRNQSNHFLPFRLLLFITVALPFSLSLSLFLLTTLTILYKPSVHSHRNTYIHTHIYTHEWTIAQRSSTIAGTTNESISQSTLRPIQSSHTETTEPSNENHQRSLKAQELCHHW